MTSIAVTGATGGLGRLVLDELLTRGVRAGDLVAVVRDVQKAASIAARGIEVRVADYGDVAALTRAFDGVDRVLLVSAGEGSKRVALHESVVRAAAARRVELLVYTSAPHADVSSLVVTPDHRATEALIAASGIPAVVLRNNWYTENFLPQLEAARRTWRLVSSSGGGRVASASRADYAAGAAEVLLGRGVVGRTYELSGDVAWAPPELAAAIGAVIGRPIELVPVDDEHHAAMLVEAGRDPQTAAFIAGISRGIREGALAGTSGELRDLIGRPTTPLLHGLRAAVA